MALLPAIGAQAQNMTDLAVMNDRQADMAVRQSDYSTVSDTVFLHPDRIRFDDRCLQIDERDVFLLSGTFHYFRTPQPLWADRLQKMKAAGFNCVETYVPWNWHERRMPASVDDMSKVDLKGLNDFLTLTHQMGLYTIVRPGPYICAEWSGGGFPQWLMQKRPAQTKHDVWLQSDDPVFVSWCEHWYRAVARVVEPHQIHHRPQGQGGVVLWQVENEYNRVKWIPSVCKRNYLEQLTRISRSQGIEVPVITCWTSEARNVKDGPLNGVVDMVNSYPRWLIAQNFGRLINQQLQSQPGKPLISGELQGGWYSSVGGKLGWEQDGVSAVQTQNITLYALQRGFCALNFYMAVGGTNFDDWASRDVTATYDFAAAISEDGLTNDRYERFRALAPLLHEHGTRIARAREMPVNYTTTDTLVTLALRQTDTGDRYYFVRTEEHTQPHHGTLRTDSLCIDFSLKPFGSQIYYIEAGQPEGRWLAATVPAPSRAAKAPQPHQPLATTTVSDPLPRRRQPLADGQTIDETEHYCRHLTYYRTYAPAGSLLTVERTGHGVVNGTQADGVAAWADGQLLPISHEDTEQVTFRIPGDTAAMSAPSRAVTIVYEDRGLQHHTNQSVEQHWHIGPRYVRANGQPLALEYACTEAASGQRLSTGHRLKGRQRSPLITWHTATFAPVPADATAHLHLEHTGNGFVYVNGHAIGRCWQEGPQRDYYIPSCWLYTDRPNHVAVSLRAATQAAAVSSISLDY